MKRQVKLQSHWSILYMMEVIVHGVEVIVHGVEVIVHGLEVIVIWVKVIVHGTWYLLTADEP